MKEGPISEIPKEWRFLYEAVNDENRCLGNWTLLIEFVVGARWGAGNV